MPPKMSWFSGILPYRHLNRKVQSWTGIKSLTVSEPDCRTLQKGRITLSVQKVARLPEACW